MRQAIPDAIIARLKDRIPDVGAQRLPVADLARELGRLKERAIWVVYLGGDFEAQANQERSGILHYAVTLAVRHHGSDRERDDVLTALLGRVDKALTGHVTGVAGAGPLALTREGLVEPPEGMVGVQFYEQIFTVEISEEVEL